REEFMSRDATPAAAAAAPKTDSNNPLQDLEHWEEFLKTRYPEPAPVESADASTRSRKKASEFRDYRKEARPSVKEFYRLNHTNQTYDFVQSKRRQFLSRDKRRMGIWDAMEY